MSISAGTRLGPYEILTLIGAGGMGEVYRGRDTKLGREVALKVLSPSLANDAGYIARFQREAKALASLNHPHIAQIYGLEENAIVMELVEGRTLAERIGAGAIPVDEALSVARQIAEALEAAHAKGIVHRDLKPANVKITPQGVVKVLDFGLAKAEESDSASTIPEDSPTLTLGTQTGVILGTAAYMSPEQAEGKKLDGRSDIFSFGTVLYEMTTGRRPFAGDSTVSILAAVLRENPRPVRELSAAVPAALARLIHRCLAKHPEKRWQSVADVRLFLQDLEQDDSAATPEAATKRTRHALSLRFAIPLVLAAILAGALVSRLFMPSSKTAAALAPPTYAVLTSDSGLSFEPAISPDGKLLAYASDRAGEGSLDIWVRQLPNGHPVRLTTDKADDREPDFSPDGSKIVFRSDRSGGGLYVISPLGGEARKVADRGRQPRFSPDGKWIAYWIGERHPSIFGTVWIVPAAGGEPKEITSVGGSGEDPVWAADSKGVILVGQGGPERAGQSKSVSTYPSGDGGVAWLYLPIDGSGARKIAGQAEFQGFGLSPPPEQNFIRPAAWAGGSIIFSARSGGTSTLWMLPVSTSTWRVTGRPVPLTTGPGFHLQPSVATGISPRRYVFSALSLRSSIVSVPATAATDNAPTRWTEGLDLNTTPSISSDGTKLAYISNRSGNPDGWLKNLRTGRESALTETPWNEDYARISKDGSQVMFLVTEANGKRGLSAIDSAGGISRMYCGSCGVPLYGDWIADGHSFVYTSQIGLSLLRIPSGESIELVKGAVLEPRGSHDGRWIVFHSIPTPTIRQVFVAPLRKGLIPREAWIPVTGEVGLNRNAAWAPDSRRVYFQSDRDGFRCIWAQNLDAASKRPVGDPFAVHHSHYARFSLLNFIGAGNISLTATQDRVFFAEPEITGNIWMLEPVTASSPPRQP